MNFPSSVLSAAVLVGLVTFGPTYVVAQEVYPNRPIKVIVPFPAGGALDVLTRIITANLAVKFGQPVIVDNKPGASGNIGTEMVVNAKPDGYTLLATPPTFVINQHLFEQLPYHPTRFSPVTVMAGAPNLLVVNAKLQASNIGELLTHARAHPGKLNYASTGTGGTPHLTTEWFKAVASVQLTHVPYKGYPPAIPPLLAGDVDMMFMNLADALTHIRSGKLKALAIGGEKRSRALPEVPAIVETIPDFVSVTWFAVAAPPGTPLPTAEKLSAVIAETLQLPEVGRKLADLHLDPIGGSPAQTATFFKEESERWGKVIRAANIKAD